MAEDFDEEASFVEENETISEMFPNLLVIKKEILNYYDNEFESTPFSVQENREPLLQEEIESSRFQSPSSGYSNNENVQCKLLNCNKIILGSKPNRVSSNDDNFEKSGTICEENNEVSIDENYFEELVTSYEPSVVLQDIQSYLHKSKRFCVSCSILFPEPSGYESHLLIFHSENHATKISPKESLNERRQHRCTICAKQFVALHVLRRHLISIHKMSNAKALDMTTKESNAKIIEDTTKDTHGKIIENTSNETNATVFEITTKYNNTKVVENTIVETNTPKITHESSDLSNTCFHCRKAFDTQKSLIEHLYDILQMKRKNTEIVPVLKSVLFKCNKCDLHFTSSQLAANHAEHMEMLINWKCTICSRIFKKEDELSHERQHSVSNNFLIYNLGDLDVANILFRCSKCATHFTESNFLYHFRDCGLEVTKTMTCKICNILLDYNLKTLHEFDKHTESKPFTIIQCDVISDNPVKPTVNKYQTRDKLKELLKSFREVKVVLQKIDSNKMSKLTKSGKVKLSSNSESRGISESSSLEIASNEHKNIFVNHGALGRRNLTYSYCRNCKCFITKFRAAVHLKGHCHKLAKLASTCVHCGLILNKISIKAHIRLHMERKDLKLTNFKFINLFNGRSMNPPTPDYPKCPHCAIHFLNKMARLNHTCSSEPYETCDLCGIKLSETAFKFHMSFHKYATDRMKRVPMNDSATTLNIGKCDTDEKITNTKENNTELTHNHHDVTKPRLNETTTPAYRISDKTKLEALQGINKKIPVGIGALRRLNVTYCYCDTCKCFVTKFKKDAHVEGRCKKLGKIACTCEDCGLILTSASINTHRRLHMAKKDLNVKNFRFFNLYTGRSMNPPIPEYPKCTHCAVHFLTRTARNSHNCSKEAYQTCNICNTKLSESAFKFHMTFHQYTSDRIKRVISKNLKAPKTLNVANCIADESTNNITENDDVLPNNPFNVATTKVTAIRERRNIRRKYEIKGLNEFRSANKKKPTNISDLRRRNLTYFYCKTCKCFVTKFKKAAHVQGRCKNLSKIARTCEHCGLIFNSGSIVTHRRLHMEENNLKLKHFRFFNLYNGRSMNPAIPEYPKCNHCAVHFLNDELRNNHICSAEAHQTCHLCDKKLSEAAFKLHMGFHQYETDRINRITSKNSQLRTNYGIEKYGTDENERTENNIEPTTPLDVAEMQLTVKTREENNMNDAAKQDASLVENKGRLLNIAGHLGLARRNVTYSYCENCKCFITKFRMDAHVQGRCKKLAKIACTCEHCGLILNEASIVTHKRLHEENKDLKLNNFKFFNIYTGRSMNPPIPDYPKCNQCAVHFLNDELKNNHICSAEAHQTCHFCDKKLSESAFKLHMRFHQYETDRINRITSKNSQSASNYGIEKYGTDENVTKSTENNIEPTTPLDVAEIELTVNTSKEYNMNDTAKRNASLVENKGRLLNFVGHVGLARRNVTYSYCENCKCFITKFRMDSHVQGRCKKMAKIACTCEHCGLILNEASIVTHKRLHEENKDLKLNNFKFFNIYTGRSMNPPIPEYPKCTNCAVHFLTKTAKNKHICSQQAYQTCRLCEIKLSQAAFKHHMSFHQYATDRRKRVAMKNSQSPQTLGIEKLVTDENVTNSTGNYIESIHNPPDVTETELAANTSQEYKMNDNTKLDESLVENRNIPVNIEDHSPLRRRNVTYYYCETCKCFITKFKKDAHVQGLCKKFAKIACTCEYCGLILNDVSIVTHRRLHEDKKDLKLKDFTFFNLYTGRPMSPPIPTYPKCNHCMVQFLTKRARNNHICSEQSYQTCHLCETKLSEAAFKLHMMFHQYPNDRFKKVTSINSQSATTLDNEKEVTNKKGNTTNDIEIINSPLDVAETRLTEVKKCIKTNQKYEISNKTEIQAENSKKLVNNADSSVLRRRNVSYSFCETCKCFITNFRKDAHIQGRCRNMAKITCTCEHCGLILNTASITTHRRLHEDRKDIKLKNFRFFNLYTGRSMNPPIPKYPKCAHCAVYFLTETARKDHVCNKEAHETCHLCEIKLSETAFKLHMTFHQYATDRMKRVVMKNSQSAITLDIEKRVTNEDVSTGSENQAELICNPLDVAESPVQNSLETYEIVYTCGNCSVSVDIYDKVVEHSQGHYENDNRQINTEVCNYCELTIDAECYVEHQNLHEKGKQFKFLKFDSYYLPSDNNLWIAHIFKTLPKEKVLNILRSSIYRFECRIKMEVIQQGDPNLTVYRCDQCSCFIEPGSLFKHSDNSCFKLRHHPCTVCGIPFNSSTSRNDHEKIHNRPGITSDSYRIVVFNRERDKPLNRSFCLRKNYVLFQCRNCGVIIDTLQGDIHKCDLSSVKKCNQCALLLHSKDFEKHVKTHNDFVSFNYSNMKVILLGDDNFLKVRSDNNLRSNFRGAIYDYKVFKCKKCEICVKDAMCMSKHICRFGKQRLKCLKCNLFFSVGSLKTHTRSHEQDPDFIRSNMNIVSFDPLTFDQNKNTTVVYSNDGEFSDSNTDSDTEILAANDTNIPNVAETIEMIPETLEEETVKLYKCTCELFFLNEDSIIRHFGVCRSKATISKQKCPKCDLLFTPNVLFTHLLAHHRKNNFRYKYDIIEMNPIQNNIVQ